MEQLEKWWEAKYKVYDSGITIGDYNMAKQGWKAALECVRDKMLPNCHEPMDIYDFIEEELKVK